MSRVDADFAKRVYEVVAQIPKGRVMTYGQIAAVCGAAWAAWEVGQIAHSGPSELPWQRVVNKQGGLAVGWPSGGQAAHAERLRADGIEISESYTVDVKGLVWTPNSPNL
jgi:methylated-DNA-protein-cysteine methyltransferase-like protein